MSEAKTCCAAGCGQPAEWISECWSYNKKPKKVKTAWCNKHAQELMDADKRNTTDWKRHNAKLSVLKTPEPSTLASATGSLNMSIRLERDNIPAWAAFLSCQPPGADNHVILMNVGAVMAPAAEYEDGTAAPQSREDRMRLFITSLMHEFGHALEKQLKLPHHEKSIESACESWESIYSANAAR